MTTEYAVLLGGEIDNVVTTQSRADAQALFPGRVVVPLESLPIDVKRRYRFWNERPRRREPEAPVRTYYDGCRDALRWYAVMRDGTYFVGSCGRTLKEALADVDEAERKGKPYGMGSI